MRRALLAGLLSLCLLLIGTNSVAANEDEHHGRVTGTLTANGCLLTVSVSWRHLPPIYRIDTTLYQDGHPYVTSASIISYPQLGQPALRSPQLIETYGMSEVIFTHRYAVEFVFKNRRGRVVARAASPPVRVSCDFA